MKRTELIDILNTAKLGLTTRDFIPILSHFCFDGETVLAYDDVIAIQLPCDIPIQGAIRGELLLSLLSKSVGDEVHCKQKGKKVSITIDGNEKIELPTLPMEDFLFEFPDTSGLQRIPLTQKFINGFKHCLLSASSDTSSPERMGVTLSFKKKIEMYSTDNVTISRFLVGKDAGELSNIGVMILPVEFCKALVDIASGMEDDPELLIGDDWGWVVVDMGDWGQLYSRLGSASAPMDYTKIINPYIKQVRGKTYADVPEYFPNLVRKALPFLNEESDGTCSIDVKDNELTVSVTTSYGNFSQPVELDSDVDDVSIKVEPALLDRIIDDCASFYILGDCIIFKNRKGFMHLVANKKDASSEEKSEED